MAHTHACSCGEVIEVVDLDKVQCPTCNAQEPTPIYCHRHHPDPEMRKVDPPQVKMTVSVVELNKE